MQSNIIPMKATSLLICIFLYGFAILNGQDSDDKVFAAARAIRDMVDLDLLDIINDQNSFAAICKVIDQDFKEVDEYTDVVDASDPSKLRHVRFRAITTGKIIVLDVLGASEKPAAPIPYRIRFTSLLKPGMGIGEDTESVSPFNPHSDYLCLLRWLKSQMADPLSDYPKTYLITPEFYSQLKQSPTRALQKQLSSQRQSVTRLNEIVRLGRTNRQVLFSAYLQQYVKKNSSMGAKRVKELLTIGDKETVGAVMFYDLLAHTNTETSNLVATMLGKHLDKTKINPVLRHNIALAVAALGRNGYAPPDCYVQLRDKLIASLKRYRSPDHDSQEMLAFFDY